jgi:beta-lactamase superfamily II metal-dependent hydrolase
MTEELQIRRVGVEFLRPGPPHNQLLSPLTQYLAICGDAGAGVVTVPYEHAAFERKLKELRYETGNSHDRLAMLHDVGTEVGRILGAVPGLPGALSTEAGRRGTLVHLRLTMSASELAHLPFELAKVPIGPTTTAETWLAIQTCPPVCLTRNIRTASVEGLAWPDRPRVLFVAGDPLLVPFDEHRRALCAAVEDFRYPGNDETTASRDGAREQVGSLLTILRNPTLADVLAECRDAAYTHVHLLTHGDAYAASPDLYGLVLRGPDDEPDVVSGERLASALTSVGEGRIHRPSVVTVASCDSGNVGTVTIPGASFAHALHQAGIPLVVASQFPLSKRASVLLVELHAGLLWGEHPLVLLQRLRAELHARYTSIWHDWASIVVYEAMPPDLDRQLDTSRYRQSRRALEGGLQRIDLAIEARSREALGNADAVVERALAHLPLSGQYAIECVGLRASSRKRQAQSAFALPDRSGDDRAAPRAGAVDLLEQAWRDYDQAMRGLIVNDGRAVQRVATLHWVLVQVISLGAVLGKRFDDEQWGAAKLAADLYLAHQDPEQRAWAHGSLAEIWMLRLCRSQRVDVDELEHFTGEALAHVDALAAEYSAREAFPVISSLRQFRRYVDWWVHPEFVAALALRQRARPVSWDDCGLVALARQIVARLERTLLESAASGGAPSGGEPGGAPPAASNGGGAPTPETSIRIRTTSTHTASIARRSRSGPFFDIEMLPAGHGDALWIEYGNDSTTHRWLVDCGTRQTARFLARRVEQLPASERLLELFVMTHIDADHIGGALPFFGAVQQRLRFADVWFNGWRHLSGVLGARQGEMFSSALQDLELPWNVWRDGGAIVVDGDTLPTATLPGGMRLTLLSPTPAQIRRLAPVWKQELERHGLSPGARIDYNRFLRSAPSTSTDVDALADEPFTDDTAPPNGSSVAFLAEFAGATALLAADAHAGVLAGSIRRLLAQRGEARLKLDAFKLPHHGSRNNVSIELLQLLDCPRFLFSSNGDYFAHPDRQAVGRVIRYGRQDFGARPGLHFNYRSGLNEVWERPALQERYGYTAHYPAPGSAGLGVALLDAP